MAKARPVYRLPNPSPEALKELWRLRTLLRNNLKACGPLPSGTQKRCAAKRERRAMLKKVAKDCEFRHLTPNDVSGVINSYVS